MSVDFALEEPDCPLCGARHYTVLQPAKYADGVSEESLRQTFSASSDHVLMDQLVQCDDCSLVYLNPRIPQEIILDGYKDAVDPIFVRQNEQRIKTFKRSLRRLASRYGLEASADTHVLDVGCAGGAFPKAAADLGFSVVGVEPSAWLAEQGRQAYGLDIRAGVLGEQDFADASFDLITLWDVIEHLTAPHEVVDDIRRLLKDDGLLVVNYPDYGSLMRRLLGVKWPFFLSVHLIYFTPQTIRRFLEARGFAVAEVRPFWQTLELGYAMERGAAYFSAVGLLAKATRLVGLQRLPLRYNMGQSFLVARKTI
jgi:SAM-dependent methyltransferase